jgi:hypothetical protein
MQQVFNKGIKPNNYIRRRGVNKFLMSFSFLLSNGNKNNFVLSTNRCWNVHPIEVNMKLSSQLIADNIAHFHSLSAIFYIQTFVFTRILCYKNQTRNSRTWFMLRFYVELNLIELIWAYKLILWNLNKTGFGFKKYYLKTNDTN